MSLEMNKLHHKMNEFLEEKNPQNEEELKSVWMSLWGNIILIY